MIDQTLIYEILFTITIIVFAVALAKAWRKNIALKKSNLELFSEVKDLEGYTRALHHVNCKNMETIAYLYKNKNHK